MEKIININEINQFSLDKIIKNPSKLKSNLTINFEENSIKVFDDFIYKHKSHEQIYVEPKSKLNIDLIEYNFDLYLFFINCVDMGLEIISGLGSGLKSTYVKLFGDIYIWNFSIYQNIMFNYPFTLENIIYIPLSYINECFKNKDYKNLTRTLVHEKLHIGQRSNELVWDKFISDQDNKWIKITKSDNIFKIIENNIGTNLYRSILNTENEEFITNPDSYYLDFKYIYLYGDELYYGHYVYNKVIKKIKIKYFLINIHDEKLQYTDKEFEQEHPYETYAYKISSEII